jgi:hypothetical protein
LIAEEMWEKRGIPVIVLAAQLITDWRRFRLFMGRDTMSAAQ